MSATLKTPKIEILHNLLWSKYKGGVFSKLHELAVASGRQVNFIQIAETEGNRVALGPVDLRYHRYPYELMFKGSYDAIGLWRRCARLFRRVLSSDADLIVLPGYHKPEYWLMLTACILRGKRRAVFCDSTMRDKPQSAVKSLAKRAFFGQCDGFFGYGKRSQEYLVQHGAAVERVFVRCQAAALPDGYTADNALARRIAGDINPGEPEFLYVGRLAPEKGLDSLVRAFAQVTKHLPNAKLTLVGSGESRNDIAALAAELGVAGALSMPGSMNLEALSGHYARANCLVLPSRSEPWGLVVNEALSYGCPVVVSDACGCVPELVEEGVTGYVVPVDDVHRLAAAMLLVAENMADRAAVARACLARIAAFTPSQAAYEILHGCEQILT